MEQRTMQRASHGMMTRMAGERSSRAAAGRSCLLDCCWLSNV